MSTEPLETAELRAFVRTVDAKSISRAAIDLQSPRATIGRRLSRLEERLGVRLLRRTTRRLVLTDAGEVLYRQARLVLEAVDRAEASVRRTDPAIRGDLRISAPPFLPAGFHVMLAQFAQRYPEVRMQVHFSARSVDLLGGHHDVALRASTDLQPGLVARTVMRDPLVVVASPDYLARRGTPRARRDLRRHDMLLRFVDETTPQTHWPVVGGGKLQVRGTFFANDPYLLFTAAKAGLGLALLPLMLAGAAVQTGELVRVLDQVIAAESQVALVYAERELLPPQVRAFVETALAWAQKAFADTRWLAREDGLGGLR